MNTIHTLETLAELILPIAATLPGVRAKDESLLAEYDMLTPADALALFSEQMQEMHSNASYARFLHLCSLTGGDSGQLTACCAIACAIYPSLTGLIDEVCEGGCSLTLPTLAGIEEDYPELRRQYTALTRLFRVKSSDSLFLRHSIEMDGRLMDFLAGVDELPDPVRGLAFLSTPQEELQPLFMEQELAQQLGQMLNAQRPIQVAGEEGRGKRLLVRHALRSCGRNGLFINGSALGRVPEPAPLLWLLKREALLMDAAVCIYGIDSDWQTRYEQTALVHLLKTFEDTPLIFCTEEKISFSSNRTADWERLELPPLRLKDHVALWRGYCAQLGLDTLDPNLLGSKYRMNPAQIAKAARRIAAAPLPTSDVLLQACLDALPPASGNIRQVQATYTFDDLKVPPQTRKVLDNICAHVNHREKVYIRWGLEKRYAYGRSVSALFAGSPGTGKTMAAHALSTALSIPLYCINLSQVVDKYIGETEKKLEQIFTLAERSNTILFFDEADSLFGKRSEVSDSKDRYANIEVSYILQRMEQYDGIVILATNNRGNMDDAFLRRIRFIADFQMPDEELRKQIWLGCFTDQTPLGHLDLDFIARKFEFSGGDIKNVALNAAFLAAKDSCPHIEMEHILQSIRMEYLKTNRVLTRAELGEYAYLFD